jgi:hypothetical protein
MSHMEEVERRSAALYKAPRVSLDDIKNAIAAEYFTNGEVAIGPNVPAMPNMHLLSICILVMKNGFMVVGKSAPASPENFDAAYGRELAKEDAIKQVWPLMGYALRDRLYVQPPAAAAA